MEKWLKLTGKYPSKNYTTFIIFALQNNRLEWSRCKVITQVNNWLQTKKESLNGDKWDAIVFITASRGLIYSYRAATTNKNGRNMSLQPWRQVNAASLSLYWLSVHCTTDELKSNSPPSVVPKCQENNSGAVAVATRQQGWKKMSANSLCVCLREIGSMNLFMCSSLVEPEGVWWGGAA